MLIQFYFFTCNSRWLDFRAKVSQKFGQVVNFQISTKLPEKRNSAFKLYHSKPHFAINAARAIEYAFVWELSPRDESTHGTFAPTTIAASSAFANFVAVL